VLVSLYTGTLTSTFRPRRERIFAANVGKRMCGFAISSGKNCDRSLSPDKGYSGVRELVFAPSLGNVVNVIGYSVLSICSFAISRLAGRVNERRRRGTSSYLPPLHICLNLQQIFEAYTPWFARRGFEHKATKFRMKHWSGQAFPAPIVSNVEQPKTYGNGVVLGLHPLKIWHSATLLLQIFIACECCQDIGLSQGESYLALVVIEAYHKIFNLGILLTKLFIQLILQMRRTSSPHSSASLSFPFARFQIARSCCGRVSDRSRLRSGSPYFYTPCSHVTGDFGGLWPVQRCPDGTKQRIRHSFSGCKGGEALQETHLGSFGLPDSILGVRVRGLQYMRSCCSFTQRLLP